MNALIGFRLTPEQMRKLIDWMDSHGLAQDLVQHSYDDPVMIQENLLHIGEVIENFFANVTQEEAYHGAQERGFPWGAIRSPDELLDDGHLQDRRFWVEVDHPELGRSFTYPGSAAIWSESPWRISHRAPLIGEHNEEVLCGEFGLTRAELALLAEGGVV